MFWPPLAILSSARVSSVFPLFFLIWMMQFLTGIQGEKCCTIQTSLKHFFSWYFFTICIHKLRTLKLAPPPPMRTCTLFPWPPLPPVRAYDKKIPEAAHDRQNTCISFVIYIKGLRNNVIDMLNIKRIFFNTQLKVWPQSRPQYSRMLIWLKKYQH